MNDETMNYNQPPLHDLDEWEDDLVRRYPNPEHQSSKTQDAVRNYDVADDSNIRTFYRQNHEQQTLEFVQTKRNDYLSLQRKTMGIWDALEFLNTLVDDSDPDTQLSQIEHCLQTAEAIRADGYPDWFILTGLIHDLGKILCLFGEPQWAVVGDTFPVGCQYSDRIVFSEYFVGNADFRNPTYQTQYGIYEPNCGLENVLMSWGHDEYLYHVVKAYLPEPALAMIRYHSFYPWHREQAYHHLMNEDDETRLNWVRKFNPYDLYTKSDHRPDVETLRPFYEDLISRFFPPTLAW